MLLQLEFYQVQDSKKKKVTDGFSLAKNFPFNSYWLWREFSQMLQCANIMTSLIGQ